MLVILLDEQLITPDRVCQCCLLADRSGQPRWRQGQLCCGQTIRPLTATQPEQYRCLMGFHLAIIRE